MKAPVSFCIALVLGLAALGVADGAETSRRAVKIAGQGTHPGACRLARSVNVGKRTEIWAAAPPCLPLIPCGGALLVYRYEIQPGSSSGLPYCPDVVVAGPWK